MCPVLIKIRITLTKSKKEEDYYLSILTIVVETIKFIGMTESLSIFAYDRMVGHVRACLHFHHDPHKRGHDVQFMQSCTPHNKKIPRIFQVCNLPNKCDIVKKKIDIVILMCSLKHILDTPFISRI